MELSKNKLFISGFVISENLHNTLKLAHYLVLHLKILIILAMIVKHGYLKVILLMLVVLTVTIVLVV